MATLFVLLNHVNMRLVVAKFPYMDGLPRELVSSLVWNGQYGVQIFFAISGFLITSVSLRRWGSLPQIRVRDFYALRFARIAPLLLLLLTTLAILHFTYSEWFFVPPEEGGLGGALFAALTFHINLLEAQKGYLPANWDVLWSLSVEELFYLVFPVACLFLGRGRMLAIFLAALVITGPFARTVMAGQSETWKEYSYLGGMDAIALGCLTAILEPHLRLSRRGQRAVQWLGIVLMALVLGFSTVLERFGLMRAGLDMTIAACGTCLVILAVSRGSSNAPAIARPLLWLGQRSYEVYLTHMFVVIGLFVAFTEIGKPLSGVPILFISAILISGLLGEMVGRFYSEPMNRILRIRMSVATNNLGTVIESSELVSEKRSVANAG
jgi:peptidoglycan/LPS O-acetylase OafA/YrhL